MGESSARIKLGAFEKRQREHVEYQPIGVRAQRRQAEAARLHGRLKPMRFVSLHHHSTFSFLDGFQLPDAHVRRATEINMGALAMTEHGNIFSHVKLEKAAEEQGVKPIFGCELYCGYTDEKRRTQRKNHLTVIAKNAEGYANLLALVTRSWSEGFHYEPTVDWRWLPEHQKGLVILSGCQGSALFTALVGGKHVEESEASYGRAKKVVQWFDKHIDDFYVEVQAFPELEKARRANPMLARLARDIGRPLVATMDCHYTAPEEAEIQQLLHNVRPGEKRTLEEMVQDWGYDVPLCPPPTDRALYRRLLGTGLTKEESIEAIISTEEIAQECDLVLPKLPHVEFPLPDGYADPVDLWRDWLREGWRFRGCHELPTKKRNRYKAQLRKEMEVIEAKGYVNYFLIVADGIRYAKDQEIPVGPARGSAAASLACWLLRITEVNPMDFDNLVFERFIDWSREDMPDIDIDFASWGRPIVRDYYEAKYGPGCVNNIGTFTMYKSKLALDDAARVHRVPKNEVEQVKELLIERSSGDLRASATIEDTVDQFDTAYEVVQRHPELQYAMDLEGNAKGFGVHAAGLVISTEPITSVAAVLEREIKGETVQVVSMDKYDAERQGLEKLDYLALSTMDMIGDALEQLGMKLTDLYDLSLDDPKVIDGFRRNDVVGIFQFDGRATRIVCGALKPDNFHEIVCVNALSRPGPLHNGAVQGYTASKWGHAEPDRIHPALDRIVLDTHYQIIFQEQILRIVRDIGGFDWTHSAYIRRIISKKLGDQEFNRQWAKFKEGALNVHKRFDVPKMDIDTAKQIWGMCITAGSYAFNAAHSTSYSKIAYWCQWLKQYHPAVFFASSLAYTRAKSGSGSAGERAGSTGNLSGVGLDRHGYLMRDAVAGNGPREAVEVLPPSLESGPTWEALDDETIRAGWNQIPGIGVKMAEKIDQFIEEEGLEEWQDLAFIPGVGPKTIETITAFTAQDDPFGIHRLDNALGAVRRSLTAGMRNGKARLPVPTHKSGEIFDAEPNSTVVFLGQPTHRNLRDLFESNRAKTGEALDPKDVKRPDLSQWVVMAVRDADDLASFVFSRYKYPDFKEVIWKLQLGGDELVLLKGKKGAMKGTLGDRSGIVFVDSMWVLEP